MRMPSVVGVAVGVGEPMNEAGQAQTAQVVGHLAGSLVAAEQPGDQGAGSLLVKPVAASSVWHGLGPAPLRVHGGCAHDKIGRGSFTQKRRRIQSASVSMLGFTG
jgi:hypothetical protein